MNQPPCDICPHSNNVQPCDQPCVFLMAVLHLPGGTPKVVTSPRYTVEMSRLGELVDKIPDFGNDIANELRNQLQLPPVASTLYGKVEMAGDTNVDQTKPEPK